MNHPLALKWQWFLAFGLCSLLLCAGCAWIPPGEGPAEFLKSNSMDETLSHATHHEPEAPIPQWPEDRWWQEFGSPELDELIDTGLKNNPGLKVAYARLHEAHALVRVEGARLLPFLEADAELTAERISEHGVFAALNPEVAGIDIALGLINPLSFRWELDFWGKNRAMMESAMSRELAHHAEWAEVRLRLTTAIARSYFRRVALRQQLEVVEAMVELRRDLLNLANIRFRSGLDDANSIMRATAELEAANKREAGTREQLDFQQYLLVRLSGHGPDWGEHVFTDKVMMPRRIPLPPELPIGLLAHRPDLAAAKYRAEAAAKMIKVAKTRFLPTIDLNGFVGFRALTLASGAGDLGNLLFSSSSLAYGGGPGLRLPWFEGGRLRGELEAQRREYDAAVELYNDTLLEAMREVADSLSVWHETRSMLEAHRRLLRSVSVDRHLVEVRFRTGLDDRREVLQQHHAVLDQEFALKALEADQLVSMVGLIEALGGGYPVVRETSQTTE
ncbi:efflux transporter outer membrane subunit [Candidatus Nitrospira allomarina]|jgi:NodT family efflux transporter outer membrane factor (OMF) lipoprotein|uniref:Efflux transporter outer membrane subunit n=1 Tax=Candidatus Nitrospira allomarina TaxID=3020900 RepID=A0AA96JSN6_9BACT|nr:efflux transporter outer membrane subunit [Candidatus Nitrospira allomarina]WNM58453.1 efflux transporter outer membrane subunit [Candidatus Nitrospira allomarina]